MNRNRLAGVEQFEAFFSFLVNPDEYRQLIKDAKEAVAVYDETVLKARRIKDIDDFRASEEKRLQEKMDEVEQLKENILHDAKQRAQELSDREDRIEALRQDVQSQKDQLVMREHDVKDLEVRMAEVIEKERQLGLRAMDLQDREIAFQTRLDAFVALKGA